MDDKKKKITAAVSAVMAYIKAEEEAAMQLSMMAAAELKQALPPAPVKLWGVSGRQTQMQMRNLMQMRAFK